MEEGQHKLEIARMPGLTRLRCEPHQFHAWLTNGATETETNRIIKEIAEAQLGPKEETHGKHDN